MADVSAMLDQLLDRINAQGEKLRGVEVLYRLNLTGTGGGSYYLSVSEGRALRLCEADRQPTATVTMTAEDFEALLTGRASPMGLFLGGRIRLEGDLSQALRLEALLRDTGDG